jgi:hypothetical protein
VAEDIVADAAEDVAPEDAGAEITPEVDLGIPEGSFSGGPCNLTVARQNTVPAA